MVSPKPPDDEEEEEEEEVCVNCGMPPCKVDPTIPITLLFSKATRQVLCLEAGKDFVDTLMGFLTLPLGCIIKLLEEASMIHRPECKIAPPPSPTFPPGLPCTPAPKKGGNESGEHFSMSSISNIFGSVVRLDNKEMSTNKTCLVDPKPLTPFGAGKLLNLHNNPRSGTDQSTTSSEASNYYGCGNACSFYTTNPATKCPKHKKKMSTAFKAVEPAQASGDDASNPGDANSQVCHTLPSVEMHRAQLSTKSCAMQVA